MHAVTEPAQNLTRLLQMTRLSNNLPVQRHQGVGCEHHRVHSFVGDDTRFAARIGDRELAQRQMWCRELIHLGDYDFQCESGASQQATPPRGM